MAEKPIIEIDSPEAAKQETMSVWVSRTGRVFVDEGSARFDGCTHRKCEKCASICEKTWTACPSCREKSRQKIFDNMPEIAWDGKTPLCIFDTDIYFFDEDELIEYCAEHELKEEDLNLVSCKPTYIRELHKDYFNDEFCYNDDIELPKVVLEMIERFNKELKAVNKPMAWVSDNKRINLDLGNKKMHGNISNVTMQKEC